MTDDNGRVAIITAFGKWSYLRPAVACALRLRTWGFFEGDILIITDNELLARLHDDRFNTTLVNMETEVEKVGVMGQPEFSFGFNLRLNEWGNAWNEVLAIDSDIAAMQTVSTIFDHLEVESDLVAMSLDRFVNTWETRFKANHQYGSDAEWAYMRVGGYISKDIPTFNTGVMAWRSCEETDEWFKCFRHEWAKFKGRNQQALSRACANDEWFRESIATLPVEYNKNLFRKQDFRPHLHGDTVLFHGHRSSKEFYAEEYSEAEQLLHSVGLNRYMRV